LPPLCAIALAPALGGPRLGTHLIQRFGLENSKKYLGIPEKNNQPGSLI
jgi:hypothetical protein